MNLDEVTIALPDLSAIAVCGLADAFGWLTPDGTHVVDDRPRGVDLGLGRGLAAAAGKPLSTEQLAGVLRRWALECSQPRHRWAPDQLEPYLQASPLYEAAGRGSRSGWVASGGWAAPTAADAHTLAVLDRLPSPTTRTDLIAALQRAGLGYAAAEHRAHTSPVTVTLEPGRYARPGDAQH